MADKAIGVLFSNTGKKSGKEYFFGTVYDKPIKGFWDKKNDKLIKLYPREEKEKPKAELNNAKENSNAGSEKVDNNPEGEDKQ